MPETTEKTNPEQVTFARSLGLFDASMIGIGAMIGAGIFVLTGIAAGQAGPASILAFALNGVVTLLTAFAYAELASAIPRAGGGYSFVRMAFPGAAGFIAGWMLWFAYTVACSLYALGFSGYFMEFFHKYFPSVMEVVFNTVGHHHAVLAVTVLIGTGFIWLNVRGAEVTGKAENVLTMSKITILAIFLYFGFEQMFATPERIGENFLPFFPKGVGGVLVAMGLTFIAFEGYDLIATVAEEIKSPEKNIPRATFISLSVTVTIYLLILFVSLGAINPAQMPAWQFLGKFKETAIVQAADEFMPAIGVGIIVFGGLLSTMSALNATVMAASRVAFSMGRDMWLPVSLAKIHVKRRTPYIAIIVTGSILLIMALTLPIEAVGSAASLIFLLTFAMVNLSVIVLRRKYPEIPRKYRVPLYPFVPMLGFLLNIFLALYQFNFQPIAWYVTAGWIAVGLLMYYAVFEKRSEPFRPQVILASANSRDKDDEKSVLVSLHNPDNILSLLQLAASVAKQRGLKLTAISVVEVPRQMPIHEGMRFTHHRQALLNQARQIAKEHHIELKTDLIIAHHAYDGILEAVEHHRADALIMGWKGYTNARDRIFGEVADHVIRFATCDLLLLKLGVTLEFDRCLFPAAGGPNAQLAATVLKGYADEHPLSLTAAYIVPPGADEEKRREGEEFLDTSMENLEGTLDYKKKIIEAKTIAGGIARASKDYDLVVIGATREPITRKILFGEIPEKVARFSPTSVLVVKKYEGAVKSILKKMLG